MNKKIFQSKLLTISVIFLFILLISSDVLPQRSVSKENDIERLIQEGKELYKNGEYREAIIKFLEAKALARTKEHISEVYFNLSLAYYANNQSDEAREYLQRSLEILPERTIDAMYYSPGFVEMFNKVKAESIKLKEKRPVVMVKPGEEKKVKKGGKGIGLIIGVLAAAGAAVALLGGKKGNGGDNGGTPTPTTGSIQVNSNPTGAQVFLDGSNTGQTTNCTLTSVSPGSHTVKLVLEGYEDEQISVSVTAGQTATVSTTLTRPTITVIELPSDTVWTTGGEVEIKWETSGSGSSQRVANTGAGLNPLINQGRRALSRFQRRAFLQRRFMRSATKEGRGLEDVDSSRYRGNLSSNTSKPQGVSGEISSSTKEGDIDHKRAEDTGNMKGKSIVGRVNIPVSPQISSDKFMPSGNIKALGLSYVKIELYKGGTLNQTIAASTENDGSYLWTVDPSLEDGTDYKVRISSPDDSSVYGESDEFQITSISIGEAVDNSDLAWSTGGNADWFGQTSYSYYDGDAAESGAISDDQLSYVQTTVTGEGTLKFYWKVSSEVDFDNLILYVDGVPVPDYQISGEVDWEQKTYSIGEGSHPIKWEYKKDFSVSEGSDCGWLDKVEFIPSGIAVTNPTSSTIWTKGRSADITWTSDATISDVKIDLYKGGTFNQTIVSSTTSDGSYTWSEVDTSLVDGTDYKLRISSTADSGVYGESDEFKIEEKSITVTEPTSSTIWTRGQSANITWTSNGTISNVKIDLYKGGTFNQTIASSTANDGSHTWVEVDTSLVVGTDYKVRISSADDSGVYGESDEFQITFFSICDAVDNCDLTWSTGGSADWFAQTDTSYYDGDAAQSGTISDYQLSYVQITVTGEGILKFYWKVSSEEDFDYLTLYVDGVPVPDYQISGEMDWHQRTYSIGEGSHSIKWEYEKDVVFSEGADCGWLDKVEFITSAITITNPTSSSVWYKGDSADITWTSSGTISDVKIDLYKGGTFNQTIVSSTANDGSYTWPEVDTSLADGSDYKIKIIDASDSSIYKESDEFTISEKSIAVTEPTSSTVWYKGDSAEITWTSNGTISDVKIDLYKGGTFNQTIVSSTTNDGSYSWAEVDASLADSTDYKIRITDASDSSIYNDSDEFTISEKSIAVTEPTSSTVWYKGDSAEITWTSNGTISDVKIDLYKGGTFNQTIVSSTTNNGSYTWSEVDTSLADGTDYNVRVSSADDSSIYGESDEFTISEKSIAVTEPTSSTIWTKGQSADITWTSNGTISDVKIDLYKGGTFNQTIVSSTTNDGSYTWAEVDALLVDGTEYKVRVSSTADSGLYGESDEFAIEEKSITVTEPTSSTIWTKGKSEDIIWTFVGTISDVKIDLYKGSNLSETIISNTENDGSYTWSDVNQNIVDGSDYKVRISSATDPNIYGESDVFTIEEKSITITEPTSSTIWTTGQPADITWTSAGSFSDVSIDLYKGGTFNQTIVSSTANDGSYTWPEVHTSVEGADYKVRILCGIDTSIYGESGNFAINYGYEFVLKWGSWGSGDGQFDSPKGVAVDSSGNVYVADTGNSRIQKFTSNGTLLAQWGSEGTGDGQFDHPYGVAVDSSGNVYVADGYNHRIQKFTSGGTFVTKWGSSGSGDSQFSCPYGVAVDSSGNVYVADGWNDRIQKFTSDGTYVSQWGNLGAGNGQFQTPKGVDVDSSGYVYVADSVMSRIQKFTSDGTYVTKWGYYGTADGYFRYAEDVAVDSSGNVYVADGDNDRIQKFTSDGTFLTKWGIPGAGDGQFTKPFGIAVDSSGNVYVAERDNDRVQKFQPVTSGSGSLQLNLRNPRITNSTLNATKSSKTESNNIKSSLTNRLKEQQKQIKKKDNRNEKRK